LRAQCRYAAHFLRRSFGLRPKHQKARYAARSDVDISGQQRVVDRRRSIEQFPSHFHFGNAEQFGVLFDELLMLDHVELQIAHGILLGEADFRHLRDGWRQQAE
jgi:hypothetical protein